MIEAGRIGFDPLAPVWALWALGGAALILVALYLWRGGRAPVSRALGLGLILLGIWQPLLISERREAADDITAIIIDQSESLALAGRREAAASLGQKIAADLSVEKGLEVRVREARGGPDGTALVTALEETLADTARDRIAGAILITDGQVNDVPADLSRVKQMGPIHALIIGDPERGDRRLELVSAPAFGIVGERTTIEARVVDEGVRGLVRITATIDGIKVRETSAETNRPFKLDIVTPKRGPNMVVLEAEPGPNEITEANNRAAFSMAGVRDRLRVLLVTGEPYAGARVWRNLLKADPSVDLVHFTILRPPEKQDFTPLEELALIAFPTTELFDEKLREFDLIIFDRYRRRGDILQASYFENIAQRVESGGAILVVAGPQDAGYESVFQTALASILPARPTGRLIETPFRPQRTQVGLRHPVTRALPAPESWGRWSRVVESRATSGQVVLSDGADRPILVLGREGRGRVAQLWSDQVWLWARGYDGGGPHGELLRRLAHWLMQEPELDDERLTLTPTPEGLTVERATLLDATQPVTLRDPKGVERKIQLAQTLPGLWRGEVGAIEQGLYEARDGDLRAYAAVGPLNPREAAAVNATDSILKPLTRESGGGIDFVGERGDRAPSVRRIDRGAGAHGGGWIGLERNGAYVVRASASEPLGPGWAWAFAGLLVLFFSWRREAS
jgi:hypothetical protein